MKFSVGMPTEMFREFDRACKAQNSTHSELVREALRQYFEHNHERLVPKYWKNVQTRAFELYEQSGRKDGHDQEDWRQAERELNGRKGERRRPATIPWSHRERRTGEDRRSALSR